jgi:phosphoglycolate phosphatase
VSGRRFDLVIFDWDGTLADSTGIIAQALQYACRDMGCAIPDDEAARYVIGLGLADALRHVAPALAPVDYPRLSARYREHYLAREAEIPLFPGARSLLADLRVQGHRLGVATGKSRAGLDRALAFHALQEVFDATRCADEGHPKPHPDMVLHLLSHLRIAPERALMVGDTTHDLQMAANAGIHGLAVTHGAHRVDRLREIASLGAVDSLDDLRERILGGAG